MKQRYTDENQNSHGIAHVAGIFFGIIAVLATSILATPANADETIDLTYPKDGDEAPMIFEGELNNGRLVSSVPDKSEGHLIIDENFQQRLAVPNVDSSSMEDELQPLPEPAAVSSAKDASDSIELPVTGQ